MFSVGSELLRTFILSKSEFTSSLPDRLRLPQRGYIWHMFCQSVREVQVTPQRMVVKYEMMDDYRIPFQQFYL
jgi:hypothetical protein